MSSQYLTKATSYTLADIKKLAPEVLDTLDFTDFAQKFGSEALDELYPPNEKCGKNYPAPSFLTSGLLVRQWRKMGDVDQKNVLEAGVRKKGSEEGDASQQALKEEGKGDDATKAEDQKDLLFDDEMSIEPAELSVGGDSEDEKSVGENKTADAQKAGTAIDDKTNSGESVKAGTSDAHSEESNIKAKKLIHKGKIPSKSPGKSAKKKPTKAKATPTKHTIINPNKLPPNSAATYTFKGLKNLRAKNPKAFANLNFNAIPLSQLDQLFPKLCGRGNQDPLDNYRSSQEKIDEWRSLSEDEQVMILAGGNLSRLKQKSRWRRVELKVGKEVKKLGLTLRFSNDGSGDDKPTAAAGKEATDATSDGKADVTDAITNAKTGETGTRSESAIAAADKNDDKPTNSTKDNKTNGSYNVVLAISPACPFFGQINIGDRLLSINGMKITCAGDCTIFTDQDRTFEFEVNEEKARSVWGAARNGDQQSNSLSGMKRSLQDINGSVSKQSMTVFQPQVPHVPKCVYELPAPSGLQALGLSFEFPQGIGAFVYGIHPRSTFRGKVLLGDKLVSINGSSVNTPNDLDNRREEMLLRFERVMDQDPLDSENHPCKGISLATLDSRRVAEVDKIKDGFQNQIACALRYKASYIETHGKWDEGPGIAGYLVKFQGAEKEDEDEDENQEDDMDNDGSIPGTITWICRVSFDAAGSEQYSFHRHDCIGGKSKSGLCDRCSRGIHRFYMCKAQATRHAKGVVAGRINKLVYESPHFMMGMLRRKIRQANGMKKKVWYVDRVLEPLKQENEKLKNELKEKQKENKDNSSSVSVATRKKPFPVMLHELVSAVAVIKPSVVSWSPCGSGFFIHNKSTEVLRPFFDIFLEGLVLPSGTEELDYRTFHRKIRQWSFEPGEGVLEGGHVHPNFRRDMASKEELYTIKRRKLPFKSRKEREAAAAAKPPPPEPEPLPPCHVLPTWNPWCHELGEGWTFKHRTRKHYNKTESWNLYISPRGRQFDTKAAARRYINSEEYAMIENVETLVRCATCGHYSCVEQNNFDNRNRWRVNKVSGSSMSIPTHIIPCATGKGSKNVPCEGIRVFKESSAMLVDNGEYDRVGIRECAIVLLDMLESNGNVFMMMNAAGEWEPTDYKTKFDKCYDALKYVKKKRKREANVAANAEEG